MSPPPTTAHNPSLTVILPCFNEERGIARTLATIHAYLSTQQFSFEIIVVDDGSTDRTAQLLRDIRQKIPFTLITHPTNKGKGCSVRDGMRAATGDIALFMDADLAFPVEEIAQFLAEHARGADVVIGSRFVAGTVVRVPVLFYRRIMEHVFRALRILILNNKTVRDTQCGFKSFTRSAAHTIFPRVHSSRFAFDAEVIFIALRRGLTVREVPVTLQNPIRSHVRIVRDSLNMIADLIRIRIAAWHGRYDA